MSTETTTSADLASDAFGIQHAKTVPPLTEQLTGLFDTTLDESKAFAAGTNTITYGTLRTNVALTLDLFASMNIAPKSRIVIASKRDDAVAYLYGATLAGGHTAVVLDPQASAAELNVLMAKSSPELAFLDTELIARADVLRTEDGPAIVPIGEVKASGGGFGLRRRRKASSESSSDYPESLAAMTPQVTLAAMAAAPRDEDDVALILFTSGSTSQPKGVMLSRKNLSAQIGTFASQYGFGRDSRIANHLPLHHTDGLNQCVLLALGLGSTWIHPGDGDMQNLGNLLDTVANEHATHLITVPTVIAMMTRLPDAYDDCFASDDFAFISSTAGYLDERIWAQVEERFDTMIVNSYGLTETCMEAIYCGPSTETRRVGTIGKPVDCLARIVDEAGASVPSGTVGELLLHGDNVMVGYFENPEATAASLREGWLYTGDLARLDDEGFVVIAGRKKSVIIRGGINVYPADVTAVVLSSPEVAEAATIGIPDDFLGERVLTCVVGTSKSDEIDIDAVLEVCHRDLAPEKIPNRILQVDRLPYGPSGKVESTKLRQMVQERMGIGASNPSAVDDRTRVLQLAADAFREAKDDLDETSTPDSVRGWDSLAFLEFILTIERTFDIQIDARDVMNLDSLGDAIAIVENR